MWETFFDNLVNGLEGHQAGDGVGTPGFAQHLSGIGNIVMDKNNAAFEFFLMNFNDFAIRKTQVTPSLFTGSERPKSLADPILDLTVTVDSLLRKKPYY